MVGPATKHVSLFPWTTPKGPSTVFLNVLSDYILPLNSLVCFVTVLVLPYCKSLSPFRSFEIKGISYSKRAARPSKDSKGLGLVDDLWHQVAIAEFARPSQPGMATAQSDPHRRLLHRMFYTLQGGDHIHTHTHLQASHAKPNSLSHVFAVRVGIGIGYATAVIPVWVWV
jgi:hypothetical protein